jgi:hypothetical protein
MARKKFDPPARQTFATESKAKLPRSKVPVRPSSTHLRHAGHRAHIGMPRDTLTPL